MIETPTAETAWFLASLSNTPFFDVRVAQRPPRLLRPLAAGAINAIVICPAISRSGSARGDTAPRPDRHRRQRPQHGEARHGYLQGAWQSWLDQRR